jgi:Uncharacterized protein conserved in bacteria
VTVRMELDGLSFEWDRKKAAINARKHGIAFDEAASTFLDAHAIGSRDDAHSGSEERWTQVGLSKFGRLLTSSYTYRDRWLRIIGCRTANARERYEYAPKRRRRRRYP